MTDTDPRMWKLMILPEEVIQTEKGNTIYWIFERESMQFDPTSYGAIQLRYEGAAVPVEFEKSTDSDWHFKNEGARRKVDGSKIVLRLIVVK